MYYLLKVKWFVEDIGKAIYFMWQLFLYKRHWKKRIEKNNFGRRPEY